MPPLLLLFCVVRCVVVVLVLAVRLVLLVSVPAAAAG
jgi:hypothetical protein